MAEKPGDPVAKDDGGPTAESPGDSPPTTTATPASGTAPTAKAGPAPKTPRFRTPHPGFGKTVARGAAAASSKLTPLAARAGDAVAAASPLTVVQFGLGFLLTVSIIAAVAFDNTLGIAATILFVPVLAAAMGALGMRAVDTRRRAQADNEQNQRQDHAAHNLERTLDYVDAKLTSAIDRFGTDRHNDAVIAMFQAKAATELCLGPVPPGPSRNPHTVESAAPSVGGSRTTSLSDPVGSTGERPSLADFFTPNALMHSERTEGVSRLLI